MPMDTQFEKPVQRGKKRYALYPGTVQEEGGRRKVIGPDALAQLYGVPLAECIVVRNEAPLSEQRQVGVQLSTHPGILHLHPRSNDDYREHIKNLRSQATYNARHGQG